MIITVVGMGKIGLPLAVQFARKGHSVWGADINTERVDVINSGRVPFPGEAHLGELLPTVVNNRSLTATTKTAWAVAQSDAVVVIVPLFVDEDAVPNFTAIDSATRSIGEGLRIGTLVSYETTLPVGTTRGRLSPLLETVSGLTSGRDFHVVFSPERVLTGRVFRDLRRYPKLVGGLDSTGTAEGVAFYESVIDFDERLDLGKPNGVWNLGSAEASELAKLAETTYRDVNIGLANQFAEFSERVGVDVYRVIEACNSQPFSHIHQPGVAVGGHCIPVYPRLYLWNDPSATIVRAARETNALVPERVAQRLDGALGGLGGTTVAVLGAAYRGGVKETAFSGVFDLASSLERRGARVLVHDPIFSEAELSELGFEVYVRGAQADAAILQADHGEYREWRSEDIPGIRCFVDGRHLTEASSWAPAQHFTIGA